MNRTLCAGLLGLLLIGTGLAHAAPQDVVVIQQGEGAPPERNPVVSVNQAVKNKKELEAARVEKAELDKRAPVYRTMADAAAAGVGVTRTSGASEDLQAGWHWWQWLGATLVSLLALAGAGGTWLWWRSR